MILTRDVPSIYYENTLLADSPVFNRLINPWNCYIAGWGGQNVFFLRTMSLKLHEVKLRVLEPRHCTEYYQDFDRDTLLCVGDIPGKGPCHGDSGGPFMCTLLENPLQYLIVGLVSFGASLCTDAPTAVTKVSEFHEWITFYSDNETHTPPTNPHILF